MKQLVCEMCGSTDLIKQDGVFVCQTCGTKYSVEEARKMMVEGTVEVTGTVKVDNSAAIKNYLDMARNAINAGNNKEADEYCNRIIEIDVDNWEAWLIKGRAVGWQSTLGNIRIPETISAFEKAIKHCPDGQEDMVITSCKEELENLQSALLSTRISNFKSHPSKADLSGLVSDVKNIFFNLGQFLIIVNIRKESNISSNDNDGHYARIIYRGVYSAWQNVYRDYLGDDKHPSDYAFTRFIEEGDILIEAQKMVLAFLSNEDDDKDLAELKIETYAGLIHMQRTIMESCSYEVNFIGSTKYYAVHKTLSSDAKSLRQVYINTWEEEISKIKAAITQKEIEAAERRKEEYWEKHQEERNQLETDLRQLQTEMGQLEARLVEMEKEKNTVPAVAELASIKEQISLLTLQKNSLGLFKGKEKKALQERITVAEQQAEELKISGLAEYFV